MMLVDFEHPAIGDGFQARINDYERRIADLERLAGVNPYSFATIAARDAVALPQYGTRVYVASTRTEYLRDGSPVGGPIKLGGISIPSYISTPDHSSIDFTGDFEIVVRIALDDWTNGVGQVLASKDDVAGTRTYTFYIGSSGLLNLEVWPMGANTASAVQSFVDGTTYWIKATYDVNNGAAGHDVKFYWAADSVIEPSGGSWTQIGTTITTAGTTAGAVNNTALWIGARPNGSGDLWSSGKFYRAIMRSPIAGTTYLDMDSANVAANSATFDSNLKTFTLNNLGPGWVVMSEPEQTYVPTLTNVTAGTVTFQNTAWFRRSDGFITLYTQFVLGTGGALTGQPTISLPAGITTGPSPRGSMVMSGVDVGGIGVFDGLCEGFSVATAVITPYVTNTAGAVSAQASIGATSPVTWAVGDTLRTYGRIPMRSRYM